MRLVCFCVHRCPVHPLPYLNAIHASSITCVTHVSDVDNIVMSKIVSGSNADSNKSSNAPWPVDGGSLGDEVNRCVATLSDFAQCSTLVPTSK